MMAQITRWHWLSGSSQIEAWLKEAVQVPSTRDALRAAIARNPFELRVTMYGDGEIRQAIKIDF